MKGGYLRINLRNVLGFVLVNYAIVLAPLVDAGLRNYMVILAGILGFAAMFVFRLKVTGQLLLWFLLLVWMIVSVLVYDPISQLASVALTAVYASGYFAVAGLLDRVPNKREYVQKILLFVIVAFAVVSALQMIASLGGLPIPNKLATKGVWSYNSLAMEPSQLGRVVGITMLGYLMVNRPAGRPENLGRLFLREPKAFISFLTTMLLSGSALAAAAIPVALVLSRSLRWAILLLIVVILAWPAILIIDYEPLRRAIAIVSNLPALDIDTLLEADASGAVRLIPFLIYLQDISMTDPGFWFGYGSDGPMQLFQGRIPGFGDKIAAGFIPAFMLVYGILLSALFMWIFLFRYLNRSTASMIVFWLLFMTSSAFNTQVLWYGLIMIRVVWSVHQETATMRRYEPV